MSWLHGLRHRFRTLVDPGRHERDLADEMRFHEELDAMQQRDASRARRRFGNRTYYQEETRRMTWLGSLDVLRQDVEYAWRSIRRTPGFTVMVVVTLALGLGANAATFTLLDRLFLRPPAGVDHPETVQRLWFERSANPVTGEPRSASPNTDYPRFLAARDAAGSPASLALYMTDFSLYMRGPDWQSRQRVRGVFASASYFSVLGVAPALGRVYTNGEDSLGAGSPVVVLGYRFWQRTLGGDSAVIGRRVRIEADEYTIVGVLEDGFEGLDLQAADVWIPLSAIPRTHWIFITARGNNWWEMGRANGFTVLRRAGIADDEFRSRVGPAVQAQQRGIRSGDTLMQVHVAALGDADLGKPGTDAVISERLGWISLIVLLIACANVVSLLLTRVVRRKREIAVRLALGISRGRLIRLLTTETVLLALLAGAASLFVAWAGGHALRSLLLPEVVFYDSPLSWRVVMFAAVSAIVAGLVAGIVPSLQASKPELTRALKEGAREGAVHRSRLRQGLIVAQAALSLVLLVGAALFVRSLLNVRGLDIGYDTDRIAVGSAVFEAGQRPERPVLSSALTEIAERLAGRPGVENVALTAFTPMRGLAIVRFYFGADSSPSLRATPPTYLQVSPSFFRTVGMRIVSGVTFEDVEGVSREIVVNEAMARLVWPNASALGQCLRFGQPDNPCYTVVGVVENGRQTAVVEKPAPLYYLPMRNAPVGSNQASAVIVRASENALPSATRELASALRRQFPGAEVEVRSMLEILEPDYRPWRTGATLFSGFALLALVVALIGIYSTVSYGVTQRTHEFGVRIALGAQLGNVLRLVIGEGVRVVAVGVVVGVALALGAGKLIASLLYGVQPHDPVTMLVVSALLLGVAALAALLPAWRASRVDPVTALRAD